ncbi:MAG TPA: hypothetical protein ENJ08_16845 [Gammaproteobacteria bacterium]|nr:hypothetical protein [Gammaproteobacteria bacterium]
MINNDYVIKIRELSSDYYQNQIALDAYRAERKVLLDKIDEECNGRKSVEEVDGSGADEATEVVKESSILMKTIAFFKNNEDGK